MKHIKHFEDYNFEERGKVDMDDYIIFLKRHDFNEKQMHTKEICGIL